MKDTIYTVQGIINELTISKVPYKEFCELLFGIILSPEQNEEYRFSFARFRDEVYRNGRIYGIRNLRYVVNSMDTHKEVKILKDYV